MNKKISRLKKISHDDSNVRPSGLYYKDSWKYVDNDELSGTQYNSTISKEYLFDKPLDNMEWRLLSKKK